MIGKIVKDKKQLTEILEKLLSDRKSDPQHTEITEAIAETYFRLALLPQTSLNDAFRYLLDGRKIDSANPRYAYHISRIMYKYGDLEAAGKWITEAVRLCPTSHRLWAHVAQLLHELNTVYNRKNEYEKEVLRKRSAALYENIKAGKDVYREELLNFTPPLAQAHLEELARKKGQSLDAAVRYSKKTKQSNEEKIEEKPPVQRIRDAGKCRWSGVIDLEIESLLEDEPSERRRDIILPKLEAVFENCCRKKTGCTEIAILTAQWLITGYPPSSIRRILKDFQLDSNAPGYALLYLLLDIFEADIEKVPLSLQQALSDHKIPSTLAAIIHKKRVLWRPLAFKTIGPYLTAKKLVNAHRNKDADPETHEKAAALIRTLLDAANKIRLSPPRDMPDTQETTEGSKNQGLDPLISESDEIGKTIEVYWARLKLLVSSVGKNDKLEHEDENFVDEVRVFINGLPERCEKALAQIASLRGNIAPDSLEGKKLNELESAIKDHITVQGKFARNIDRLPLTQTPRHMNTVSDESQKPESLIGIEGLEKAVKMVDTEIDTLIDQSLDTFSPYSHQQRLLPPIAMLHLNVLMQSAELLYRMKRRNRAKELWLQCLKTDRLFAPALKNIAVADTTQGSDHAQALLSWKSYSELLYLPAIISGNPHLFAAERAAFHRDFALAFSQGFFVTEKEQKQEADEEKSRKFIDFINNPGAINEYIAHKKAELLNLWFEMQTHTLLLGTNRSVKSKDAREKTIEVFGKMINSVCKDLPGHIGLPFMKCCMRRLDIAMDKCLAPEGLTEKSNPFYHDDEKRITLWIQNIYTIKEQLLLGMYSKNRNNKSINGERYHWENIVKSPDFVFALEKLNGIPVDFISRDLLDSAIEKYGTEGRKNIDAFLTSACQLLMIRVLKRNDIGFLERIITLLAESDDPNDDLVNAIIVVEDKISVDQEEKIIPAGYDNNHYDTKLGIIIKSLENNRDIWEKVSGKYPVLAGWLDMPGNLNNTVRPLIEKLNQDKLAAEEINKTEHILKQWCDKYPQIAGPAYYMGCLLYHFNKYEEAGNYFDGCIKNAFSDDLKKAAQSYLDHINESVEFKKAMEKGDFRSLVDSIKNQLTESPGSVTLINSLLSMYQKWIENKPSEAHKLIPAIEKDIAQAIENAKSAENSPEFNSQINELIRNKRQLVIGAALKETGQPENADKAMKLKPILKKILETDSENAFAWFFLSQCAYQIGAQKWQNTSGREGKQDLSDAQKYANQVMNADIDENYKEAAKNMVDELDKVL